jgi:S-adenosylmethionine synthetase
MKGGRMRVLLTGASGLLGRAFVRQFAESSELYATAFSRSTPPLHRLDLRSKDATQSLVQDFRPQLIIHSAAERRPDICENDPEATDALNVSSVEFLAEAAKEVGATLVYISTDYVFDGTTPPYAINASANPLNYYGRSKLAGERAALESGAKVCVLRVPILYGPVESLEESAVTLLARLLESNGERKVDHWAIRFPTHVDDVAAAVRGLADVLERGERIPKILHFSGDEALTKYEMARMMAEACNRSSDHLRPDSEPAGGAPRPHNCQLDDSLLMSLVEVRKRSFRRNIGELIEPHLRAL